MNVSKLAKRGMLNTQTGTPYYASPEVWKDKPYNQMSDIWSLGCILYEMATLKPPFQAENMEGLYMQVIRGTYEKIPSNYSKDLQDIISLMLQIRPQSRISTDQILGLNKIMSKLTAQYRLEPVHNSYIMMKTIQVPKNISLIQENLPSSNYN